jgi:peptide/nickel transport system permease protein
VTVSAYLLRRARQLPLVVFVITVVVFGLVRVTPGDPVLIMLGVYASPEAVAAMREEFNLDRSLPVQYLLWLGRVARGDLGISIRTREPVTQMIIARFPTSLTLASAAILLAVLIAAPLGILAAYRRNSWLDHLSMVGAMAGLSMPNFALALLLIYVFAVRLGWVPITGIGLVSVREAPWRAISPYILPVVALGVAQTAVLARLLRSSMLEVLSQEYIRVARSKGLGEHVVLVRHALRNALIPVITVIAIQFAYLVGSTITIEFIFAIPGLGSVLINAVVNRDFPVVQGFTLFMAVFFILSNLVADLAYLVVDPRIRYA